MLVLVIFLIKQKNIHLFGNYFLEYNMTIEEKIKIIESGHLPPLNYEIDKQEVEEKYKKIQLIETGKLPPLEL